MTRPPHNREVGAGLQPDADGDIHMGAGVTQHVTDRISSATDNPPELELDFSAPIPDGAYDGADLADENTEATWKSWALHEIGILAALGVEFTADDVRKVVGEPDNPNRWGGVFLAARRLGLIVPTGTIVPSTTASRHGAIVRVWRGKRAA